MSGIRYRERASYGTEYACRAQKCFLRYATHFRKHSVRKTGFYGTEGIFGTGNPLLRYGIDIRRQKRAPGVRDAVFKGPQNSTCYIERIFKGPQNSRLHRLWTASCRTGRIFSARNGPRSLCSLRQPLPLPLRRHSVLETDPARR